MFGNRVLDYYFSRYEGAESFLSLLLTYFVNLLTMGTAFHLSINLVPETN